MRAGTLPHEWNFFTGIALGVNDMELTWCASLDTVMRFKRSDVDRQ